MNKTTNRGPNKNDVIIPNQDYVLFLAVTDPITENTEP